MILAEPPRSTADIVLPREADDAALVDHVARFLEHTSDWCHDFCDVTLRVDQITIDITRNPFFNGPDAFILPRTLRGRATLGGCRGDHAGRCDEHCQPRAMRWLAALNRRATNQLMLDHAHVTLLRYDVSEAFA